MYSCLSPQYSVKVNDILKYTTALCYVFVFHQNREKGQVFKHGTRGALSGLTANTIYKIWMTASTVDREGERSDVITVKTCKGLISGYPRYLKRLLRDKTNLLERVFFIGIRLVLLLEL